LLSLTFLLYGFNVFGAIERWARAKVGAETVLIPETITMDEAVSQKIPEAEPKKQPTPIKEQPVKTQASLPTAYKQQLKEQSEDPPVKFTAQTLRESPSA